MDLFLKYYQLSTKYYIVGKPRVILIDSLLHHACGLKSMVCDDVNTIGLD